MRFPSLAVPLCVALWSLLSFHSSIAEAKLQAGAARQSIVPPFPTNMGGFHDRTQNFTGVHDEIFTRALVLENDGVQLVIIGSDLMSVDAELIALAREGITAATKIPATNILICCTHDHSAPSYYQKKKPGEQDAEPSLKKFLAKQFIAAAVEAHAHKQPCRVGFKAGELRGATRNRQQKNDDVIDPQVGVLRVEALEGRKTIATLCSFTGHPVIIGSTNLELSGEFPGAACRAMEGMLGGVAIYLQGACGDITVNRSGDPFLEIERLGRTIAGEAIKISGLITLQDSLDLQAASQTISLVARPLVSLADAEQALKQGEALLADAEKAGASATALEGLKDKNRVRAMSVERAKAIAADPKLYQPELKAEVQVLRVGDVVLVAIPGELFVEYALEMRARVKQETGKGMCLVGYANGHLGYIVTPRGMETGGYEASVTQLDVPGGRRLTETAMELVRGLRISK